MSDFDAVLGRLLTEPAFAAALAADPDAVLSGYRLAPDESALLRSQVTGDLGGQSAVERRETKSSTFGLFLGDPSFGAAPAATAGFGAAPAATAGFGAAPAATAGFGAATVAASGLGAAPVADGAAGEPIVVVPATAGGGAAAVAENLARVTAEAAARASDAGYVAPVTDGVPPAGYANRVDADGDGRWDRATYRGRVDGGVDILVDLNGDGRADFVGHDDDGDRTVDSAHYDTNHDGRFETRMHDDDGDGWLDRTVRRSRHD